MGVIDLILRVQNNLFALRRTLAPILPYIDTLADFAENPYLFLRKRLLPVILGGLFSVMFSVADAIARPFASIVGVLELLELQLAGVIVSVTDPVDSVITQVISALRLGTSGLGPFQPFILVSVGIVISYVLFIVIIRLSRGVMDAIPILSGVETFLFG
ncbi:hypothetical protein ACOZ4L_02705 [Haloplanus ruber]|uniref:Yip1 domain-containing protein n=1 Tax=Haloplanus ruber TaxID=869892 RepID=A0ABD6D0F0_9EURY|nr:hypothetical protein [Haloplanus ruber]